MDRWNRLNRFIDWIDGLIDRLKRLNWLIDKIILSVASISWTRWIFCYCAAYHSVFCPQSRRYQFPSVRDHFQSILPSPSSPHSLNRQSGPVFPLSDSDVLSAAEPHCASSGRALVHSSGDWHRASVRGFALVLDCDDHDQQQRRFLPVRWSQWHGSGAASTDRKAVSSAISMNLRSCFRFRMIFTSICYLLSFC